VNRASTSGIALMEVFAGTGLLLQMDNRIHHIWGMKLTLARDQIE
jgi:hypothetical protein